MEVRTHRGLRLTLLVVSIAGLLCVHGPLLGYKTYANIDEAYASALASRLLDGYKLYEGAVSQRGPAMYYFFALIAKLHGWDNIVALRCWALALVISHLLLVDVIAKRFLSRSAHLVALAVTSYQLIWGFPAYDGAALHGEALQLPFLLGGAGLGAWAMTARGPGQRTFALSVSGILFGIAVTIKQAVFLHVLPFILWIVIDHVRRGGGRAVAIRESAIVLAGSAGPAVVCVLHSWRQGTLAQMYYYCVVYNRDVHLRPTTRFYPWLTNIFLRLAEQTAFIACMFVLTGVGFLWLRRRYRKAKARRSIFALFRGFGSHEFFALHLMIAFVSASMMWRFFPHYYLQAAPFLALCMGIAARRVLPYVVQPFRAAAFGAFIGFLTFCAAMACIFGERVDGRITHDRTHQDIAHYIEATTRPDDRIFVWGFSPTIYGYSHRRPASRFVFETYVTGMVPWYWERLEIERARVVPGSMEGMIEDLRREKPAIVVDAGSVMLARSIRLYPESYAWLREGYCFEMRLGAFDLYRRVDLARPDGGTCHDDPLPLPYPTTAWSGLELPIPTPLPLDKSTMQRLPIGNYNKAIWFPERPRPPQAGLDALRDARVEEDEAEAEADGFYIPRFEIPTRP